MLEYRMNENTKDFSSDKSTCRNNIIILLTYKNVALLISFRDIFLGMELLKKLHRTRGIYTRIADINSMMNQPLNRN